jgi:hypothetical protein
MSDKKKSKGKTVTKLAARNVVTIEISLKRNATTLKNEIIYLDGATPTNGDVDVDTEERKKDAFVHFFSHLGPLAIVLHTINVKGEKSDFKIEGKITNRNQPITIKIPQKGRKGDIYKYSVALFTDSEVVTADPKLEIAN